MSVTARKVLDPECAFHWIAHHARDLHNVMSRRACALEKQSRPKFL